MYGVHLACIDYRLALSKEARCKEYGLDAIKTITIPGVSLGILDAEHRPTRVADILTALSVFETLHGPQAEFFVAMEDHLDCGKFGLDPHTRDHDQADIHLLKMQEAADILMAELNAARPDVMFILHGFILRSDGGDTIYQDVELVTTQPLSASAR